MRRARLANQFIAENKLIKENNAKLREKDDEIARFNKKIIDSRREDAKFEVEKAAREKARQEKEEAFKREMEEMEAERERKRKEREERRKAEEEASGQ